MKLLLFYAPSFWFKTYQKVLEHVDDQELEANCQQAVVVFYHVETDDLERRGKVTTKFVKNIKWLAGKFDSNDLFEGKVGCHEQRTPFAGTEVDEGVVSIVDLQFRQEQSKMWRRGC